MSTDIWPDYCHALLASSVAEAAARFPARGEDSPERVHGVRKILKESRALARLLLPTVGEPARVTITALAAVRRRVGRARDLDVMESRLERLEPPRTVAEPLSQAIGREREAAKRAHTHFATAASRAQLGAIVKRLEGWDVGHVSDADIALAVARTYAQALRRGRVALASNDPSALHALRSRVVDLRYQLAALSPAWPATLSALSDELNALRDTLGDFNDLDVLSRFATERGGLSSEALTGLTERLKTKQGRLRRRAEDEFDRLFAETPDAFAMRLAAYLRHPIGKFDQKAMEALKARKRSLSSEPGEVEPPRHSATARDDQKSTANPLTSQSP